MVNQFEFVAFLSTLDGVSVSVFTLSHGNLAVLPIGERTGNVESLFLHGFFPAGNAELLVGANGESKVTIAAQLEVLSIGRKGDVGAPVFVHTIAFAVIADAAIPFLVFVYKLELIIGLQALNRDRESAVSVSGELLLAITPSGIGKTTGDVPCGIGNNFLLQLDVEVASGLGYLAHGEGYIAAHGHGHVAFAKAGAQCVVALNKAALAHGTTVKHAPTGVEGVVSAYARELEFAGGNGTLPSVGAVAVVSEYLACVGGHVPAAHCGARHGKFALGGVESHGLLERNLGLVVGGVVLDLVSSGRSHFPSATARGCFPVAGGIGVILRGATL